MVPKSALVAQLDFVKFRRGKHLPFSKYRELKLKYNNDDKCDLNPTLFLLLSQLGN